MGNLENNLQDYLKSVGNLSEKYLTSLGNIVSKESELYWNVDLTMNIQIGIKLTITITTIRTAQTNYILTIENTKAYVVLYTLKQTTVSALIKAPLKINYDPLEAPSLERKKFLRGPGGALFREAPSN